MNKCIDFLVSGHTFDEFVVSSDVMQSGEPNSLGADEGTNSVGLFAETKDLALAQDDCVHVGVHAGIDKRDVI